MRKPITRTRRAFVPGISHAMEARMLLSTLGHAPVPKPDAHVENHAQGAHHAIKTAANPSPNRWAWFANTYWYVPPANLPATLFNSSTGTLAAVSDQTVFEITGYRNGYFWGKVVTQLGSSTPSTSSMVGSVTPEGKVLLSFTQTSSGSSPSVTNGYGVMVRKAGQWSMENQMFTSPSDTLQIGHWAYMLQTRPGLPSWNSLPAAGVSVPTFLSEGSGSGPVPIGS